MLGLAAGRSAEREGKNEVILLAALLGLGDTAPSFPLFDRPVVDIESSDMAGESIPASSGRTARAVACAPEAATWSARVDAVIKRETGEGRLTDARLGPASS